MGATRSTSHPRHRQAAFSMIELLLVVVITLLVAGIAMPAFMRSFQSSQLRTSTRTIVMSAKYCRSMSVLQQKSMALLMDRVLNTVEVISITDRTGLQNRDKFLDGRAARATEGAAAEEEKHGAAGPIVTEVVRPLARDVKIESFESSQEEQEVKGLYWVNFYPNGMCDGFEVQLEDKQGKRATVSIDAITASAKVTYDR